MIRMSVLTVAIVFFSFRLSAQETWSKEKAKEWYRQHEWLVGCNYTPAYAINQLEMWQAATFDTASIDKELQWAHDLGFNMIRVFLHDLLWKQDAAGFKQRIDRFLAIADRHQIKVMLVLFDSCWDPFPKAGKQRQPVPHVHNSGWVQSPGRKVLEDLRRNGYLQKYVEDIIGTYATDNRILAWDLVNEADNGTGPSYEKVESPRKEKLGYELLKNTFSWARAMKPEQPLTAAPWLGDWSDTAKMKAFDKLCFYNSDIITFHNYDSAAEFEKRIQWTRVFDRPVICTEYLARPRGNTFREILPLCKQYNVGACNWGFVDGKIQTKYPWDSWTKKYTAEPAEWFHDVLKKDGTPYREEETIFIKQLTNR